MGEWSWESASLKEEEYVLSLTFSKVDLGFQAFATSATKNNNLTSTSSPVEFFPLFRREHGHSFTDILLVD